MKPIKRPGYLLHRPTGQARVRIDGRDIYLGKFNSAESRKLYDELIAEWLAQTIEARTDKTEVARVTLRCDDLALLYLEHARTYYRKNGVETSEVARVQSALRHLVKVHGPTLLGNFGPKALQKVRASMVAAGWAARASTTTCTASGGCSAGPHRTRYSTSCRPPMWTGCTIWKATNRHREKYRTSHTIPVSNRLTRMQVVSGK